MALRENAIFEPRSGRVRARLRAHLVPLLASAAVLVGGCATESDRVARGEELYRYCEQCHGEAGEGNAEFKAPPIAGLDQWYLEAQLHKFRQGARGDHPDDVDGLRMRPMARTLASAAEVETVAAYVASLEPVNAPRTLDGDLARGEALWEPCVQCHGERGRGNREMNAPKLHLSADWYLVAQLEKFKAGIRGGDPQDTTGAQMMGMVSTLPDDQAMHDVVAYITAQD